MEARRREQPLVGRGCAVPERESELGRNVRLRRGLESQPRERGAGGRARAAIDIARDVPAVIDRADAVGWLADQCATRTPGTTLVVYHSVVWQYLPEPTQTAVRESLRAAGARASADAPIAWLRLEPTPDTYVPAELRLTLWDGSPAPHEWLLATTGFHGGPIAWRGPAAP